MYLKNHVFKKKQSIKNNTIKILFQWLVLIAILSIQACTSSSYKVIKPNPDSGNSFLQHAQSKQNQHLKISASILTEKESYAIFGLSLKLIGVQAIWVSVENRDRFPYWLLYPSIDPDYYAPDEVAYAYSSTMSEDENYKLMQHLRQQNFKNPIHANETKSGFIFVNRDEDYKAMSMELLGNKKLTIVDFLFTMSGLNYENFYDIIGIHNTDQLVEVDEAALKLALEQLPCCTTNQEGDQKGDPLNLIFIGNAEDLFPAFAHRGWHPAEKNYWDSSVKTVKSFLFGHHYHYSPVSPLYALGRKQDIALQKARGTIHKRQHLRLWLTSLSFQGKSVWVGQVSRDIGVRFTNKTPILMTHKIDPDIDEARNELTQEMLFSRGLSKIGYVSGVPISTIENPAYNLTGDPYFNDGLRVVLMMNKQPMPIENIEYFDWQYSLPTSRHINNSYESK